MTASEVLTAVLAVIDGAVGVPTPKWYVAIVNLRHEKAVQEKLTKLNIESYVATQKELRVWSIGKRKLIDRVVISLVVFIKCTEKERREIVSLPYITRFMVSRITTSGTLHRPVAVIS